MQVMKSVNAVLCWPAFSLISTNPTDYPNIGIVALQLYACAEILEMNAADFNTQRTLWLLLLVLQFDWLRLRTVRVRYDGYTEYRQTSGCTRIR